MPIRVQYGPAGLGLQAAAQAGQGDEFAQRFADEQRMVQSARQHQVQQQRLRQQWERLRQAQEARRRPTAGPQMRRFGPLPQHIQQQRQPQEQQPDPAATAHPAEARRQMLRFGGEDEARDEFPRATMTADGERFELAGDRIIGMRGEERIPAAELQRRAGFAFGGPQQEQEPDPMTQAKLAFANAMGADNLPSQHQQSVMQMVQNPEVDLSQFRMAISKVQQNIERQREAVEGDTAEEQGGLTGPQRAQMQVHTLGNEAKRLQQEVQDIAANFTPVEQQMTVREYQRHIQDRTGDLSWLPFNRGGGLTEEEAEQQIAAFRRFKEKQGDLQSVRERRNRLIGLDGEGRPAADLPTGNGQQLTKDQAQQFLRAAGGDPTIARSLARKQGFTF